MAASRSAGEARSPAGAGSKPPGAAGDPFFELTPDRVLEAVEAAGLATNPVCYPLNSFENRVYEVELVDRTRVVVKFYRPGRWSREQILEEHTFLADLAAEEVPVGIMRPFPDGETLQRLTDHWAIDVAPAWAPDGRRLAFCSARAGSPQIYVMNVDGSGVTRVSRSGSYNTSPAWAPTGDRLEWTTRAGGGFQIVVAGADGSGAKTITAQGSNENPSWAPDGRYLVFSSTRAGGRRLFLADRDGRTQKQLTRGAGDDTSSAWSPRLE